MNQRSTQNQIINVQDYYRGWEKAQREYQRQFEKNKAKTLGKTAEKVPAVFSLLLVILMISFSFKSDPLSVCCRQGGVRKEIG